MQRKTRFIPVFNKKEEVFDNMKDEDKKMCNFKIIIKARLKSISDVINLLNSSNNDNYYISKVEGLKNE